MTGKTTRNLYENVVLITEDYLGPAAHRFVGRQIISHLGKIPQDLAQEDLPKLIEWSRVTMSLLTNERRIVDEYIDKLAHLEVTSFVDVGKNNP